VVGLSEYATLFLRLALHDWDAASEAVELGSGPTLSQVAALQDLFDEIGQLVFRAERHLAAEVGQEQLL
jgi:hypothetical protein